MADSDTSPSLSPLATPPKSPTQPPIQQTPIVLKSVTQPFSMGAINNMSRIYKQNALETRGHYFVGMHPVKFLEEFLPWNESTPNAYRERVPTKRRVDKLRSVPPEPGQLESTMYGPFVEALDRWITPSALEAANVPNPQTFRFLRSPQPDTSCEGLNVDVSTYWKDEFPNSTTFSSQQTHEEFKPSIGHDAFQHEADEPHVNEEDNANYEDEYKGVDLDEDEPADEEAGEQREGQNQAEAEEINEQAHDSDLEDEDEDWISDIPEDDQPLKDQVQEEDLVFNSDEAKLPKPSTSSGVETDTVPGNHTRGQIAAYAGLALSMAFRNHFFSMLILGRYARFIRWDRRGAVVTRRFDYTKRPLLIFNFYLRYCQLTLLQRGFDPSVKPYRKKLPPAVEKAFARYYKAAWYGGAKFVLGRPSPSTERFFRIEITDAVQKRTEAFFIPAPRYRRACLFPFCRATRRSLACPDQNEKKLAMCFLKDSWQEESLRTESEADIYRILKEAKVQHVASMRLGGDVDGLETETQNWFSKLAHNPRYRKLGKMICHRVVLDTVARDLSTFAWCKVLLSCVADAVEATQQAYNAGVLHRDLSAGNIMIVKDKETKEWRGVLIDWDMALLWKKHEGEARTGRTGTWAFISAKIQLTRPPVTHMLWDDIESAFWVLVHQALRYLKHDVDSHSLYDLMQRIFAAHTVLADGSVTGGHEKMTIITFCALKRSRTKLAQFKVTGLNTVLEMFGDVLEPRYQDEPHRELKEPDEGFAGLLRKAALTMEPLCITPTGLKSPTNDSNPPANPKERQRASIKDTNIDFFLMPWTSSLEESTRVQDRQAIRVSSTLLHFLDGISTSKRPYISEPEDKEDKPEDSEDKPSPKKRRKVETDSS